MSGILAYEPRDQVISVAADCRLSEIAKAAAPHHQTLPVCPPRDPTVSEVVMEDLFGLAAGGHGRIRDWLLGIEATTGDGAAFTAGGRVVKNVTGFDLMRLACGSRGTLMTLRSAHLRLAADPAARCVVGARCGLDAALQTAERLRMDASLRPVSIALSRRGQGACLVAAAFEGAPAAVDAQCATASGVLEAAGDPVVDDLPDLPGDLRARAMAPSSLSCAVQDLAADADFTAEAQVAALWTAASEQPEPAPPHPPAARLAAELKRVFDPGSALPALEDA